MLHERPGVQTSRQADENQGIGDYQMHLDIMDYSRGITTTPIYIHEIFKYIVRIWIRTLEFPLENIAWFVIFFSYYTNPIENTPNPNKSQTHISSYLHISRLHSPFSIFYRLFAAPSVEPGGACYRRSTRFPEYSTSALTMRLSSNAPCTSQWDSIHLPRTIEIPGSFDICVVGPWLCSCVAGKETRCRSTADNRFPRSMSTCRQTWFETQGSWKCQKVLITSVWFSFHSRWVVPFFPFRFSLFLIVISGHFRLAFTIIFRPESRTTDKARATSNPGH